MTGLRRARVDRRRLAAVLAAPAAVLGFAGCGTVSTHTITVSRGGAGASRRPITLPARLGGFQDLVATAKASGINAAALSSQRTQQTHVASATIAAYRQAYGGAAVAYRAYANPGLTLLPSVIAVRASSPGLVIGPVPDAALLGLAKPPRQVIDSGPVQCAVDWEPSTAAGHDPPPSSEVVSACQRRGAGLTVFTGAGAGFTGPAGLARAAALTNAAFAAAGG